MNPLSESNSWDSGNGSMDSPSWPPHGRADSLRSGVLTPFGTMEKSHGKFVWGQKKQDLTHRFPQLGKSEDFAFSRGTSNKNGSISSGDHSISSPAKSSEGAHSSRSSGSPKIISFSSFDRDTPPPLKSWASIVSGPKSGRNSTVIRPKAAPVLVIPKATAPPPHSRSTVLGPQPLSAGYADTAPSYPGRIRILQRSESDTFGHPQPEVDRKSFIPAYIQMQQSHNQERFFHSERQGDFSEDRFQYQCKPVQRGKTSMAKLLGFSLPDRYEQLPPQEFVEQLRIDNKYNPGVLVLNFKNARFFLARGHTEDDLLYSVAHNAWSTTDAGNQRLDAVFSEQANLGPVYLFFAFSGSDQICGMAELLSGLECPDRTDLSSWDRWKAQFRVKWIFLKDVPVHLFEQISVGLGNNKRSVVNARDCSEVPSQDAKQMAKIIQTYAHRTSLLDSFVERCNSSTKQNNPSYQRKN